MNWIELLLCAAALGLAAVAFRRSGASAADPARDEARDAALRQEMALLAARLESLPGRIADEIAASPLREAVEAVRGDISKAVAGQSAGLRESQQALVASISDAARVAASEVAAAASPSRSGIEALREAVEAVRGDISKAVAGQSAGLQSQQALLAQIPDSIRGSSAEVVAAVAGAVRESAGVREALDSLAREVSDALSASRSGNESVVAALGAAEAASASGAERTAAGIRGLAEVLEAIREAVSASSGIDALQQEAKAVSAALDGLPVRIAQEVAARPAPAPELEELAAAVRESGHLRGDVARQVAEAVSRVGQELSESAERAVRERDAAADALREAVGALTDAVSAVRESVAPLGGALAAHAEAVSPLAAALEAARDRLEEASGTLRANQAEFSASVDVFGRGAQELSAGLSAFAREGELGVAEDPRAVQKALLEALERILSGFSESLRALLGESDVRLREALAELAARIPGRGTEA